MKFATRAIHAGAVPDPARSAVQPLYLTSTYVWPDLENPPQHTYSRESNPTRDAVEQVVASLEGGKFALAYASGMAAESAAVSLLRPRDRLVVTADVYGGTYFLCERVLKQYEIETVYVDCGEPGALERALEIPTRMVWLESPTNPLLNVVDLAALAETARNAGALVVVDNTFATPYLQNPLALGADIVVHSATKYIGGHSDLLGGFVVTNDPTAHDALVYHRLATGGQASPFDCWLMLRGLKTLAARMREHERNAFEVARFLEDQSQVIKTLYPGLPTHPQHDLAKRQMRGFGGMVAVELKGGREAAVRFCNALKVFQLAASLGGVESLAGYPPQMSHFFMSAEQRAARGITDGVVRLSVGLEDSEDLLADLDQALSHLG